MRRAAHWAWAGRFSSCSTGGFDTHSDQLLQQVQLMSEISQAMSTFYQATQELGVANQVTTFTLSEFNRTLQPGTNDGTDHAWGSHQIDFGRRGQGQQRLRNFPDAGAWRTGRCRIEWPLDSDDRAGSIRSHAGILVWRAAMRTCRRSSRIWRISRPAISASWDRFSSRAHPKQ